MYHSYNSPEYADYGYSEYKLYSDNAEPNHYGHKDSEAQYYDNMDHKDIPEGDDYEYKEPEYKGNEVHEQEEPEYKEIQENKGRHTEMRRTW